MVQIRKLMVLLKRKVNISCLRSNVRLYSNPAVSLNEEFLLSFDASQVNSKESTPRMQHLLAKLPSNSYIRQVLEPGSKFTLKSSQLSRNSMIKHEIYKLIELGNYQELLELMGNYMRLENMNVQSNLSSEEIGYIMRVLIDYQIKTLVKSATRVQKINPQEAGTYSEKVARKHKVEGKLADSYRVLVEIRSIYSMLIFNNVTEHIYAHDKRIDFFEDPHAYELSILDYENLIMLELRNNKMDLACKWFRRYEAQFGSEANLKMTLNLWILKLQTFCGGLPSLWPTKNTELYYKKVYSVRKSHFKGEMTFISVFNDFLTYFSTTQGKTNKKLIINRKFNQTLIYSIGYSENMDYLRKYIEFTWGIGENGRVEGFTVPEANDSNYPDIEILKSVLVAFSYNGEFFEAMKYINSFQQVYKIDTDSIKKSANALWEQVFKWCNTTTRFDEKRGLQYFLKQTRLENTPTLDEAQRNVNFDYEGYLSFMENLKKDRINIHQQLWQLYLQTKSRFSLPIARSYYHFLTEDINQKLDDINQQYFEFLTYLLQQYHKYHVGVNSFNRRSEVLHRVSRTDQSIRELYTLVMKAFIDNKWKSTYAGQCQPLISKWSLDQEMKQELNEWFVNDRLPKYQEMIDRKRQEFMVGLRTEDKDDESLLNLM